jgi:hypothetical protein
LLNTAIKKETVYRQASRQHSTEERSLSLIRVLRGLLGVNNNIYLEELGTEDKEEEKEQKKK